MARAMACVHLVAILALCVANLAAAQQSYQPSDQPQPPYKPSALVVRTHRTTFIDELEKAMLMAVVGLVLFVMAFPLLWFNERREAIMWKLFGRAAKIVKADVSSTKVNPENDCCLVHVPGEASTQESLADPDFDGVAVTNCVKLIREVEMYQWVEHEHTEERDTWNGGKEKVTTYSYSQDWVSSAVNSSSFVEGGHDNPPFPPFEAKTLKASNVALGAFKLPDRLVDKMHKAQSLAGEECPPEANAGGRSFHLKDNMYTTVGTQWPQLGDVQVDFKKVPCGDTTVLAVQDYETFSELKATTPIQGNKVVRGGQSEPLLGGSPSDVESILDNDSCCLACGKACAEIGKMVEKNEEIFEIVEKRLTVKEMFKRTTNKQEYYHTGMQLLGFLMMLLGLMMLFGVVPALFRIIPFVGTWIQMFGNAVAFLLSLILSAFFWCVTVAAAWFRFRPAKTVVLLAVAVVIVVGTNIYASHQNITTDIGP